MNKVKRREVGNPLSFFVDFERKYVKLLDIFKWGGYTNSEYISK